MISREDQEQRRQAAIFNRLPVEERAKQTRKLMASVFTLSEEFKQKESEVRFSAKIRRKVDGKIKTILNKETLAKRLRQGWELL